MYICVDLTRCLFRDLCKEVLYLTDSRILFYFIFPFCFGSKNDSPSFSYGVQDSKPGETHPFLFLNLGVALVAIFGLFPANTLIAR
jgi:hypothetical protein